MSVFLKSVCVFVILTMCALVGNAASVAVETSPSTLAPIIPTSGNQCKENQTKDDGCNNCFCANGRWGCTLISCSIIKPTPSLIPIVQQTLPPIIELCSDGQSKTDDCNMCTCSNGGWWCTRRACPKKAVKKFPRKFNPTGECTMEGATKTEDGKTCTCSDSIWRCYEIQKFPRARFNRAPAECKAEDKKGGECICLNRKWHCTRTY